MNFDIGVDEAILDPMCQYQVAKKEKERAKLIPMLRSARISLSENRTWFVLLGQHWTVATWVGHVIPKMSNTILIDLCVSNVRSVGQDLLRALLTGQGDAPDVQQSDE